LRRRHAHGVVGPGFGSDGVANPNLSRIGNLREMISSLMTGYFLDHESHEWTNDTNEPGFWIDIREIRRFVPFVIRSHALGKSVR
jgi:hypothetical protein